MLVTFPWVIRCYSTKKPLWLGTDMTNHMNNIQHPRMIKKPKVMHDSSCPFHFSICATVYFLVYLSELTPFLYDATNKGSCIAVKTFGFLNQSWLVNFVHIISQVVTVLWYSNKTTSANVFLLYFSNGVLQQRTQVGHVKTGSCAAELWLIGISTEMCRRITGAARDLP